MKRVLTVRDELDRQIKKAKAERQTNNLVFGLKQLGLPEPEREVEFWPSRKFRFDLAFREVMLAVELDGGIYTGGRHVQGQGYERDCVKQLEAMTRGWVVARIPAHWCDSALEMRAAEYVAAIWRRLKGGR